MPSTRKRTKFRVIQKAGKFYWQLQIRGTTVAQSTKGYSSARNAKQAIEGFQRNAPNATIEENGE